MLPSVHTNNWFITVSQLTIKVRYLFGSGAVGRGKRCGGRVNEFQADDCEVRLGQVTGQFILRYVNECNSSYTVLSERMPMNIL